MKIYLFPLDKTLYICSDYMYSYREFILEIKRIINQHVYMLKPLSNSPVKNSKREHASLMETEL